MDAGKRARESVGSSLTMLEDDCQSVCDAIITSSLIQSSSSPQSLSLRESVERSQIMWEVESGNNIFRTRECESEERQASLVRLRFPNSHPQQRV